MIRSSAVGNRREGLHVLTSNSASVGTPVCVRGLTDRSRSDRAPERAWHGPSAARMRSLLRTPPRVGL